MIILKKLLKVFGRASEFLEPVSRRILLLGSVCVLSCYVASWVLIGFWRSFFPDPGTAWYWGAQCALLAKELLGAAFVPVLLFEILLIALGKKQKQE